MDELNEVAIENFSCWSFVLHGDVCNLGALADLYPRGDGGEGEHVVVMIHTYLFPSDGELIFIGSDGSVVCTRRPDADSDGSWKKFTGPKFEEVVAGIRENEPLHDDRLILRWKVAERRLPSRHRAVIHAYPVFLQIKPEELNSKEWKVISEIDIREDGDENIDIRALKTGSTLEDTKVKFELIPSVKSKFLTQTCIWMVNSGNIIRKYEDDCILEESKRHNLSYEIPLKEFLEKELLTIMRCKFISGKYFHCSGNQLPLDVHVRDFFRICGRNSLENTSSVISNPTSESTSMQQDNQFENAVDVLTKDLMCLYQDHDFADMELRCNTVSFPTHKNILSARSPVFKAMLSGDMREAACGQVVVEDMDPHTLGRFLSYLYSGSTGETLDWGAALKLYYVADKYQVPSLKKECAAVLRASVALENVCDILSLADKHRDEDLRSSTHDFIVENYNDVLGSDNWVKFMKSDPLLAVETLTSIATDKQVKMVKIKDSN